MIYLLIPNTSVHEPLCVISPIEGTFYALERELSIRTDLQVLGREFSLKIGNSKRLFKQVNIYTRNVNGRVTANNELFYVLKVSRFFSRRELFIFAIFLKNELKLPQTKNRNIIDIINITKIQSITKYIENYGLQCNY